MYNIGIIMGGVMPVPAVCGGAIETLMESIAKQYTQDAPFRLTIFSVYHKDAAEAAKRYPDVRFVWTHTNTFWNLSKHAVFMAVRGLTGRCIRGLQRHYNEIAPVIRRERFDLLLVEGGDEQAVLDIAKGYRREQLIFHAHIHFIPKESVAKGFGHMIGVSEFVVREYEKACTAPVKTHLLRNAIDTAKFSKAVPEEERHRIRAELGLSDDDFVVLYVGRIMEIKGVLELMQAIVSIPDEHVKLLMLGSANSGKWAYSPYERNVRKLSRQNRARILYTGYVDNAEVYRYAAASDIQCLPTLVEEAAPLVVLESMAEGIPLLVTDTGGVAEYVGRDTALLIARENLVENLKTAILDLQAHPDLRKQMSQRARARSKRYQEPVYYENFVKTISQITGENELDD